MREFEIPAKKRLCPGAIPSRYPKRKVDDLNLAFLSSPEPKPKRQADAKLEKNRILSELIPENESTSKAVSEDRMEVPEIEKMEVDNPEPGETVSIINGTNYCNTFCMNYCVVADTGNYISWGQIYY
ncbi:uncharacterized protein LOC130046759 [Ostrea edulis]|uniref:uncharacterized protein LOC130046759 n=1 Tax=Ostrea edulis TaxID=37623 RepID=UPI0024AE9D71|nr:uncharacterized protein LOC130046759 [Ostrea edulis]